MSNYETMKKAGLTGQVTDDEITALNQQVADLLAENAAFQSRIEYLNQLNECYKTRDEQKSHDLGIAEIAKKQLAAQLAELKEAQRWIPVSEELPDDCDEILVYAVGEHWHATFSHDAFSELATSDEIEDVTHWQPLPPMPEEKDNER